MTEITITRGVPANASVDWRHRADCRDEPPELWFPVGTGGEALLQAADAKAVCAGCPVRLRCLQWAIDASLQIGIFGGIDEDERRVGIRRLARADADVTAAALIETVAAAAARAEVAAMRRARKTAGGGGRKQKPAPVEDAPEKAEAA